MFTLTLMHMQMTVSILDGQRIGIKAFAARLTEPEEELLLFTCTASQHMANLGKQQCHVLAAPLKRLGGVARRESFDSLHSEMLAVVTMGTEGKRRFVLTATDADGFREHTFGFGPLAMRRLVDASPRAILALGWFMASVHSNDEQFLRSLSSAARYLEQLALHGGITLSQMQETAFTALAQKAPTDTTTPDSKPADPATSDWKHRAVYEALVEATRCFVRCGYVSPTWPSELFAECVAAHVAASCLLYEMALAEISHPELYPSAPFVLDSMAEGVEGLWESVATRLVDNCVAELVDGSTEIDPDTFRRPPIRWTPPSAGYVHHLASVLRPHMPFPGVQWAVGPNRWDPVATGMTALLVRSAYDPVIPGLMDGADAFLSTGYERIKALAFETPT